MTKILFLCTGNSCRSQMAEGWARALYDDRFEIHSAGMEEHGMNPRALRVMEEAGVDMSDHYSKTVDTLRDAAFDVVVTVCDRAKDACPSWLCAAARTLHTGFDDPPRLAQSAQTEAEALDHYRRVRDEIRDFIKALPEHLVDPSKGPH